MIIFECPGCTRKLQAADEYAGKKIACPSCKAKAIVPPQNQITTPLDTARILESKTQLAPPPSDTAHLLDLKTQLGAPPSAPPVAPVAQPPAQAQEEAMKKTQLASGFAVAPATKPKSAGTKKTETSAMAISTTCPNCRALFRLADEMTGKKVRCQKCNQIFVVATAEVAPPPTASAPAEPEPAAAPMPLPPMPATAIAAPAPVHVPPNYDHDEDEGDDKERSAPPPIAKKRADRRPAEGARRQPSGSGAGTTVLIVVLVGGGLLGCLACTGVGGYLVFAPNRVAKAKPGPLVADNIDVRDKQPFDGKRPVDPPKVEKFQPIKDKVFIAPPPAPPGAFNVIFGPDGTFRSDNQLNQFDPVSAFHGKHHKLYIVRMEAGVSYQIDLMSNVFDSYLYLFNDANQKLWEDDDSGGNLNARIFFTAPKTGLYRIHATYFAGGGGPFALIVAHTR